MSAVWLGKPDRTLHVGDWVIDIYTTLRMAVCYKIGSKSCYIIRPETDEIKHLPNYVIEALRKDGFLIKWRDLKLEQIITRLNEISKKLEKTRDKNV